MKGRIPELDGIRGLAILLVFVCHAGNYFPNPAILLFTNHGWCGVDLFFVLSGFLITGILLDTRGQEGYFPNFYARRVLRIFPLYYASLVIVFGLLALLRISTPELALRSDAPFYFLHLSNWVALKHPNESFLIGHFWSLSVEEQFYLTWPITIALVSTRSLVRVCVGLLVTALALRVGFFIIGVAHETTLILTPTRFDGIAMGSLAALSFRGYIKIPSKDALFYSSVLFPSLFLFGQAFPFFAAVFSPTVLALGFGATVLAAAQFGSHFFRLGFLRWLGRYSYGLYVFHVPFLAIGLLFGARATLVRLVFTTLAIGCAAWVSFRYFETPFLNLKERFSPSFRISDSRPVSYPMM